MEPWTALIALIAAIVAALTASGFTLVGVIVGAILTPYFETRWARRLRAHQIRLDTLAELHDTYDKWVTSLEEYRGLRTVYLTHGKATPYEILLEYQNKQKENMRLHQHIFALLSRLDAKELGTIVSTSVAAGDTLVLDDKVRDLDAFHNWMIQSTVSASTAIG